MGDALRLSVVLPVYNEKKTFREVIERLLAKTIPGFEIEICLIESNSTDGTREDVLAYANHPRVRLLLEDRPSGKGHAVRKGLEVATGDIILIQDADLEYDLADYEKLLDPIRRLETSFVLGSRHPTDRSDWQIRHFSEQRGIASFMNLVMSSSPGFSTCCSASGCAIPSRCTRSFDATASTMSLSNAVASILISSCSQTDPSRLQANRNRRALQFAFFRRRKEGFNLR